MSPAGVQALVEAARREALDRNTSADTERTRRLLREVERYKAACAARGQATTEVDSWAVLLSALSKDDPTAN
jgi:hypothetical protein